MTRRLFKHTEGSIWEIVKDKPFTLSNPFTQENRRPTPMTFKRDYTPVTGPGQVQ